MNNAAANRALLGKGTNLGHDIVAGLFFDLQGTLYIDLVVMSLQIGQLVGRHPARLMLSRGQSHPDAAHQLSLVAFGPQLAHGIAAVPPRKRRNKSGMVKCHGRLSVCRAKGSFNAEPDSSVLLW